MAWVEIIGFLHDPPRASGALVVGSAGQRRALLIACGHEGLLAFHGPGAAALVVFSVWLKELEGAGSESTWRSLCTMLESAVEIQLR